MDIILFSTSSSSVHCDATLKIFLKYHVVYALFKTFYFKKLHCTFNQNELMPMIYRKYLYLHFHLFARCKHTDRLYFFFGLSSLLLRLELYLISWFINPIYVLMRTKWLPFDLIKQNDLHNQALIEFKRVGLEFPMEEKNAQFFSLSLSCLLFIFEDKLISHAYFVWVVNTCGKHTLERC